MTYRELGQMITKLSPAMQEKAERLFWHYMDAVDVYLHSHMPGSMVKDTEAQEEFRRRIEDCIDVPEQGADDFRRQIAAFCWHQQFRRKKVDWTSNFLVAEAICKFLDLDPDFVLPKDCGKFRTIDDPWEPS